MLVLLIGYVSGSNLFNPNPLSQNEIGFPPPTLWLFSWIVGGQPATDNLPCAMPFAYLLQQALCVILLKLTSILHQTF